MRQERVLGIIRKVSAGNGDMEKLLGAVYGAGKELIDKYPEGAEGLVTRKMVRAAGALVKRRISADKLLDEGGNYWESEEGRVTSERVSGFVETRIRRRGQR